MNNTTAQTEPTTTENILDTDTLWARREFLHEKYDNLRENGTREQWDDFTGNTFSDADFSNWKDEEFPLGWLSGEESEGGELFQLDKLHDDIGSWAENTTMVREDHFVEYAENWARGLHEIPEMLDFYINWEMFADNMRQEWSTVCFMGEEYLVQNC